MICLLYIWGCLMKWILVVAIVGLLVGSSLGAVGFSYERNESVNSAIQTMEVTENTFEWDSIHYVDFTYTGGCSGRVQGHWYLSHGILELYYDYDDCLAGWVSYEPPAGISPNVANLKIYMRYTELPFFRNGPNVYLYTWGTESWYCIGSDIGDSNGETWSTEISNPKPYVKDGEIRLKVYAEEGGYFFNFYGDETQLGDFRLEWEEDEGEAPTASFTYSPDNPKVDETVHFDASASYDPDGTIISYDWDFGDGHTGTGIKPTHSYSQRGTYTVILTVVDNDNLIGSTQENIIIIANYPPVADFTYSPLTPEAGETIHFDASASYDPDGMIIYYQWDFQGDGGVPDAFGFEVTHVYNSPGTYTVELGVGDNDGAYATIRKDITVIHADNTPPSVSITKPLVGHMYYHDQDLGFNPSLTLSYVLFGVTVIVDASDADSGIDNVKIYIDDTLVKTLENAPYQWYWGRNQYSGLRTLKAEARDNAGNIASDSVKVAKYL